MRERIFERVIPLARIIFFEDMRFDFIILFERIGAIMPDWPAERDIPEPLIELPIWPDWANAGTESKARAAAMKSVSSSDTPYGAESRAAGMLSMLVK